MWTECEHICFGQKFAHPLLLKFAAIYFGVHWNNPQKICHLHMLKVFLSFYAKHWKIESALQKSLGQSSWN